MPPQRGKQVALIGHAAQVRQAMRPQAHGRGPIPLIHAVAADTIGHGRFPVLRRRQLAQQGPQAGLDDRGVAQKGTRQVVPTPVVADARGRQQPAQVLVLQC